MIRTASVLILYVTIGAGSVFAQQTATATAQQPAPPSTHLKVGQQAPEFTLMDTGGKAIKLSDYKGKKNVVLAFYVLAFTGG